MQDEVQSYTCAVQEGWLFSDCYWGLHLAGGRPNVLGATPLPTTFPVKIAKFVGDDQQNWHGYPVAHWLSPWDRPGANVLLAWETAGIIRRAARAKIQRGKRCAL